MAVKKVLKIILTACMIVCLASCARSCFDYVTYHSTHEYKLEELEDGIYGYYQVVTSNVPSENYDMITVYFGGRVYTLDGNVRIHYSDSDARLVWTNVNVVHGDTLDVYAPKGSIIIRPTTRQES